MKAVKSTDVAYDPPKDTRCLECSHSFPEETLVIGDKGFVECPKCRSTNVERIIGTFRFDGVKVQYKEGQGHD